MHRIVATLLLVLVLPVAATPPPTATRVHVDKSDRVLVVYAGARELARFRIALGDPVGPKRREGDRRTPEGRYVLDWKNPRSAYFRSIHISYPDRADRERARAAGVPPGGAIFIHGQPNDPAMRARVRAYPFPDWTDGCIALSDADMARLWAMVRVPIPIEIVP